MKCTTKILIGALVSGALLVAAITIFTFSFGVKLDSLAFKAKPVSIDVSAFRVVDLHMQVEKDLGYKEVSLYGDLNVLPMQGGKQVFTYPEDLAPYLSVVSKQDTLRITVNVSKDNLSDSYKKRDWIAMSCSPMTLTVDPSLLAVRSDIRDLTVNLSGITADSLSLAAHALKVDSCSLRALSVQDTYQFKLLKSQVTDVHLDLDGMGDWSVNNCRIENEYLTGSDTHYNEWQKSECRHVYWTPKSSKAKLQVVLKDSASISSVN